MNIEKDIILKIEARSIDSRLNLNILRSHFIIAKLSSTNLNMQIISNIF